MSAITSSVSASSPHKERWMTVDPADIPCPTFGWYVPRYLRPPSSAEADTGPFPASIPGGVRHLSTSEKMEKEEKESGGGKEDPQGKSTTASSLSSSLPLASRSFFPPILSSLWMASAREKDASSSPPSSSSPPPPSSSFSPAEQVERIVHEMEKEVSTMGENHRYLLFHAVLPPEAQKMAEKKSGEVGEGKGETFVVGDWEKVTPLDEMWNAPPLSSKVPPATDFARLLARCTANTTTTGANVLSSS